MTSLVRANGLELPARLARTDLELEAGTVTALVGPNGSGKTSLLHALAAIPPATGTVTIAGKPLRGQPPAVRQKLAGMLAAERDIAWPIRGRDLLTLGIAEPREHQDRIEQLKLEPLLERRVDRLSSGERARLLLGRLQIAAPQLLLLDEPLANLDPYWQLAVMAQLRASAGEQRSAIVLAIHDLAAARSADRLLLMERGRIVWDGPASELMESGEADRVFGARWTGAEWELSLPEDRRSSP